LHSFVHLSTVESWSKNRIRICHAVTACVAFLRSLFHRFGGTYLNARLTHIDWLVSSIPGQGAHSRFMSYFVPPSLFQLGSDAHDAAACSAKIENPKVKMVFSGQSPKDWFGRMLSKKGSVKPG